MVVRIAIPIIAKIEVAGEFHRVTATFETILKPKVIELYKRNASAVLRFDVEVPHIEGFTVPCPQVREKGSLNESLANIMDQTGRYWSKHAKHFRKEIYLH